MQVLKARLRIHMIFLAIVIVLVLAVCAWIETQTLARIFLAFFGAAATIFLVTEYQKESRLAEAHLLVEGAVIEVSRGRRVHRRIRYEFLGLDGKHYEGNSGWNDIKVAVGDRVWALCRPDDPTINKPLERFLFYSFRLDFA